MGLLADIGRANPYKVSSGLLSQAATMQQTQIENQRADEVLRMQQEEANRKQKLFEEDQKKKAMFFPASFFGIDQNAPSDSQRQMIDDLTSAGIAEKNDAGIIGVRGINVPMVQEYYAKAPEKLKNMAILQLNDIDKKMLKAKTPEDKQTLLDEHNAMAEHIRGINALMKGTDVLAVKHGETILDPITFQPKYKGEMEHAYKLGQQVDKVPDPSGSGALGVATYMGNNPDGSPKWAGWTINRGAESGNQEMSADLARLSEKLGIALDPGKPILSQLPNPASKEDTKEAMRIDNYIKLQAIGAPTFLGTTPSGGGVVGTRGPGGGNIKEMPIPGNAPLGPKSKGRMPEAEIVALAQLDTLKQDIGDIKSTAAAALAGPFKGRARDFANAWANDPQFTAARNSVAHLVTIVYGLSGKQINENEMRIFEKEILPKLKQPGENFKASLENFETWVNRIKRNRVNYLKYSEYMVPPEEEAAAPRGGNDNIIEYVRDSSGRLVPKGK